MPGRFRKNTRSRKYICPLRWGGEIRFNINSKYSIQISDNMHKNYRQIFTVSATEN